MDGATSGPAGNDEREPMSGLEKGMTIFIGGLITVALFSTLVSKKSQTPAVLNSAGEAISGSLTAAKGA